MSTRSDILCLTTLENVNPLSLMMCLTKPISNLRFSAGLRFIWYSYIMPVDCLYLNEG